jgi:hypothetical protein
VKGSSAEAGFVDAAITLDWLDRSRALIQGSRWAPALAFEERDLLDLARSHASTLLMRCIRAAPPPRPAAPEAWRARLERRAKDLRVRLDTLRASDPLAPADVLFWPREPTHLHAQVPVARALLGRGASVRFVTSAPATVRLLSEAGLPVTWTRGRWPWLPTEARARSSPRIRGLAADPGVALPELRGSAPGCALHALRAAAVDVLPMVIEARLAAARLARRRPRVVVIGNDLTPEGRAAQDVFHRFGIPTASLAHGFVSGNPLSAHHTVDRMLVEGDVHRRHLLRVGVPEERVVVVGAPHLDARPAQSGRRDPEVAAAVGADAARPFVLVALSGAGHSISQGHHEAIVTALARCSALLPDVDFVVRCHWKDSPDLYRQKAAEIPGARLLLPAGGGRAASDIAAWLQGAGALVTGASASAVDAMFLGVPVVTVDLHDALGWVEFVRGGATLHATSEAELEGALRRALADPHALDPRVSAFLRDSYGPLDGRSAERAADALLSLFPKG